MRSIQSTCPGLGEMTSSIEAHLMYRIVEMAETLGRIEQKIDSHVQGHDNAKTEHRASRQVRIMAIFSTASLIVSIVALIWKGTHG